MKTPSKKREVRPLTRNWRRIRAGYGENARSYCSVRGTSGEDDPRLWLIWDHVGSGESGKSTIVKQMKIIHQNGYTQEERTLYRLTIYKNLIDCMKALVGAMQQFEIEPEDQTVRDYVEYILEYNVDPDPDTPLDPKAADAVEAIWKDPAASKTMDRQSEFYLMDSAP
jgi:guanine nucleotide-binding protein subunit alpha